MRIDLDGEGYQPVARTLPGVRTEGELSSLAMNLFENNVPYNFGGTHPGEKYIAVASADAAHLDNAIANETKLAKLQTQHVSVALESGSVPVARTVPGVRSDLELAALADDLNGKQIRSVIHKTPHEGSFLAVHPDDAGHLKDAVALEAARTQSPVPGARGTAAGNFQNVRGGTGNSGAGNSAVQAAAATQQTQLPSGNGSSSTMSSNASHVPAGKSGPIDIATGKQLQPMGGATVNENMTHGALALDLSQSRQDSPAPAKKGLFIVPPGGLEKEPALSGGQNTPDTRTSAASKAKIFTVPAPQADKKPDGINGPSAPLPADNATKAPPTATAATPQTAPVHSDLPAPPTTPAAGSADHVAPTTVHAAETVAAAAVAKTVGTTLSHTEVSSHESMAAGQATVPEETHLSRIKGTLFKEGAVHSKVGKVTSGASLVITGVQVAGDAVGMAQALRHGEGKKALEHGTHAAKEVAAPAAMHLLTKADTYEHIGQGLQVAAKVVAKYEKAAEMLETAAKFAKGVRVVGEKMPIIGGVVAIGAASMETGAVAIEAMRGHASWTKVASTAVANGAEIVGGSIGFGADVALREAAVYASRKVVGEENSANHSATVQLGQMALEGGRNLMHGHDKRDAPAMPDHAMTAAKAIGTQMQQTLQNGRATYLPAAQKTPEHSVLR